MGTDEKVVKLLVTVMYPNALIDGGDGENIDSMVIAAGANIKDALDNAVKHINDTVPAAHGNAKWSRYLILDGA